MICAMQQHADHLPVLLTTAVRQGLMPAGPWLTLWPFRLLRTPQRMKADACHSLLQAPGSGGLAAGCLRGSTLPVCQPGS